MFGVVLWCNSKERTAVIWCEDHGDLAVFRQEPGKPLCENTPKVGDLVRFEVVVEEGVRRIREIELVVEDHAPDLAEALRNTRGVLNRVIGATQETARSTMGKILPFPAPPQPRPGLAAQARAPRTGTGL